MSLKNLVTFVAGGTGIVGSGIVNSLVQNGAKCCIAGRSDLHFEELKKSVPQEYHSNLDFYKADLSKESECIGVREEILKKEGKLNHVIASMGGWRTDGPLSTVTVENYHKGITDLTLPHFVVYRTFSKMLSETPKSTYTFITGGSAKAKFFDPRASLIPIKASTIYGMYISAVSEYKGNKNLAINEFRLYFWIRKKLDSNFDPKKSQLEVGHDYVGKFLPKIILKHKSDVYEIQTRNAGNQLYEKL